jgi:hypothetical protein
LADLLRQNELAVVAAEEFARAEHEAALDPTVSPDPHAARQRAEDAAFAANGLKTLGPRLFAHFQKIYAQEQVQTYVAKFRELAPERDALAAELRATYRDAADKLVDLFTRPRLRAARPPGPRQSPPGVEVLERIDTRVLDKTTLPDWPNPDRNVWPPPSNFAAAYVQSMGVPRHPGAAWSDPKF